MSHVSLFQIEIKFRMKISENIRAKVANNFKSKSPEWDPPKPNNWHLPIRTELEQTKANRRAS
ncbi:MAG: hypothetical protein JWM04_205 [Verrucomicrobiales bacterium]|nr:hypothetical protein [Verrucomicrobiales bacterium]